MGCNCEKPDWRLLLGFQVMLENKSPVPDLPLSNFQSMWRHHSTLPHLCSLVSWWGPKGHNASAQPGDDIGSHPCLPMKDSNCIHFIFCNLWICLDQTLHLGHALFNSNDHRMATMVNVFKCGSAKLKFFVPVVNCRSWCRLVSKVVWQTLEAFAGKTSPDDNYNASLQENLSVKVFLQYQESCHPYQTVCHLEQVWPKWTKTK